MELDSYESNLIDVLDAHAHRLEPSAATQIAVGRTRLMRKLGSLSNSIGIDLGKVFKPDDEVYGGGYFEARIMKEYGASAHLRYLRQAVEETSLYASATLRLAGILKWDFDRFCVLGSMGIWGGEFVVTVSNRYKVTAKAFAAQVEIFNAVAAATYSGSFRVSIGDVVEKLSAGVASIVDSVSDTLADGVQVLLCPVEQQISLTVIAGAGCSLSWMQFTSLCADCDQGHRCGLAKDR